MCSDAGGPSVLELVMGLVEGVTPDERRHDVATLAKAFLSLGEMDEAKLGPADGRTVSARRAARAVFLFKMALGWERLASGDPPGAFACFQEAAKREPNNPALLEALEIIRRQWGVA